jgi:hypothetical protein
MTLLLVQSAILVISVYVLSKGVQILTRTKSTDPNRANNLLLGAMLVVLGLGVGVAGLAWMMKTK